MFANRLKELRKEKNLTQLELATILDVSPSTVSMYEQGRRNPEMDTLIVLSKFFDCSTDYILGNTNTRKWTTERLSFNADDLDEEDIELVMDMINRLKKNKQKK